MSSVAEKLQRKSQKAVATKQVRLKLVYVDFWSAVKLAFLFSVALAIVSIVLSFLVWTLLTSTGLLEQVDATLAEITGGDGFSLTKSLSLVQVMGFSVVVGLLNVVVITALGAISAVLYNLSVKVTGGLLVGFTNN